MRKFVVALLMDQYADLCRIIDKLLEKKTEWQTSTRRLECLNFHDIQWIYNVHKKKQEQMQNMKNLLSLFSLKTVGKVEKSKVAAKRWIMITNIIRLKFR